MEKVSKKFRFNFLKWIPIHFFGILKLRFLMALRNKMTLIYRFITPLPALIFSIILPKLINSINDLNPNVIFFQFYNFLKTFFFRKFPR